MPGRPRLAVASAIAWLAAAVATVIGALWWQPLLIVTALAPLLVAVALIRRAPGAGPMALLAGLVALPFGLYGLLAIPEVAAQVGMCTSTAVAALASSYPGNFCQSMDWPRQIGTMFVLLTIGAAGVVTLAAAAQNKLVSSR
jgi:hypothetical protein